VVSVAGDGGSVLQFKILRATLIMSVGIPDQERWTVARKTVFVVKMFVFLRLRILFTGICVPNFFLPWTFSCCKVAIYLVFNPKSVEMCTLSVVACSYVGQLVFSI